LLADVGPFYLPITTRRTQRLATVEQFKQGRTPLQVIEAARHGVAVADAAVRDALERAPPRLPAACREGCAWCCHKLVGTAAPEVLRIVKYLQDTLSPEGWAALRQRIGRGAERRRGLSLAQLRRSALPCPLLVENRCSAYPVRPLTCRGYNSTDPRRCERDLAAPSPNGVPVYAPQQRLTTFVLDGLRAGLQDSKLDGAALELTAALQVAVETPDVLERWLAGEAVFAPARLP
jgi:Fe-S-cluster containining protein